MRSTSGHGYTSQQEGQNISLSLLSKTTSFLHAATVNGNAYTKNSKAIVNNFMQPSSGQYMTQTSSREFNGRDISNIQANTIK